MRSFSSAVRVREKANAIDDLLQCDASPVFATWTCCPSVSTQAFDDQLAVVAVQATSIASR